MANSLSLTTSPYVKLSFCSRKPDIFLRSRYEIHVCFARLSRWFRWLPPLSPKVKMYQIHLTIVIFRGMKCGRRFFFFWGGGTLTKGTLWLVFNNDVLDNDVILLVFVWCFSRIYLVWAYIGDGLQQVVNVPENGRRFQRVCSLQLLGSRFNHVATRTSIHVSFLD